jgi:glycosyltransferase involved in cell wall biosynthesis
VSRTASVIVPTFNRSHVVVRALDSIREQDHRPIDLIVIDDASTDSSGERIAEWAETNPSRGLVLRYIKNEENRGPGACRNLGIELASGEYIYFLDSDDAMAPELLATSIYALDEADADCVIFGFVATSDSAPACRWLPLDQPALRSFLQNTLWGYTSTSVKRASLVRNTGHWIETIRVAEDYEYLGRALLYSTNTVVLQEALLTTHPSSDSLGSQKMTDAGLNDRLYCERSIAKHVHARKEHIPNPWLADYADRLLATSLRTMAQGKRDFARNIMALSRSFRVGPRSLQRRFKSTIVSLGPLPCRCVLALSRVLSNRAGSTP